MNLVSNLQTYVIAERFERAMKSIRGALADSDLDIVDEVALPETRGVGQGSRNGCIKILLVSCPVLDFEAVALGRAAAVFFPLHVLVSAAGDKTQVSLVNPVSLIDARLPVGAVGAMNRLVARVELALESLSTGT